MVAKVEINNAILKISNEHRVLLDALEKLDRVLLEPNPQKMFSEMEAIQESLQTLLANHFRYEEQILFPALIVGIPVQITVERVLTLSRQHGIMFTLLESWRSLAYLLDHDNPSHVRFLTLNVAQLMDLLKSHVKSEVEGIFPMISQNPRCLQLMETFASERVES